MMIRGLRALVILPLAVATMGFQVQTETLPGNGQPGSERFAQSKLPRSDDPFWSDLAACKVSYDNKTGLYAISLTAKIKALNGKVAKAKGFILPVDGIDETKHFLLTLHTPVCFYCPPGEPNEVIEVVAKRPIPWNDALVTIKGRFELVNDGEAGLFFRMIDAEKIN
jgi:hypothetical protein